MNPKTTGILLVVAAALAAFVYLYEIEGETGRQDAEEAQKRLFSGFDQESIEKISLQTADGVGVEIQRVEGRWRIQSPLDFPADSFAIDGIASTLTSIQSESVIDEPRPPEVYGLGSGGTQVRFTAGGAERSLSIGNATPVGSNVYAATDGNDSIYIVASHRTNALAKAFDDLREKRISRFDSSSVRRIRLSWPDGDGRAGVAIDASDEGWRLIEPIQGPADEAAVDDLLSNLSTLRADGFLDEPGTDQEMGFDQPVFEANIELAAEEGGDARVIAVVLGGVSPDGGSRIVRGAEDSLYTIPVARTDDFPTRLDPYRFRQVAKFSPLDAKRVEMGFLTAEGETIAATAAKSDDGWTVTPDEFVAGTVASMVTELSRLRAESILADELGPNELTAIGLDPPQASIVVYGDDDNAPLAEIRMGTSRHDGIPAQVPDNATVFKLAPGVGENVPLNHEALENHFLASAADALDPASDAIAPSISLPVVPEPNE